MAARHRKLAALIPTAGKIDSSAGFIVMVREGAPSTICLTARCMDADLRRHDARASAVRQACRRLLLHSMPLGLVTAVRLPKLRQRICATSVASRRPDQIDVISRASWQTVFARRPHEATAERGSNRHPLSA